MFNKLTPSQTNADYSEIPEDIEYYIKESVMAKQPELTLWEFMDTRPDLDYERWAIKIGSTLTETYEAKPFARLDINEQDFYDFMSNNKQTCQKKYYERRPYHGSGDSELTSNYPMKCGYNARNTIEYNWGLYGDSNERVKELIGTRDVPSTSNEYNDPSKSSK